MSELSAQTCEPCRGGIPPLGSAAIAELLAQLETNWQVIAEHHLQKEFTFPDFKSALAFTNLVGELAEAQGHHPDLHLAWGKVGITIWTHKIDGLHQSDFILAAKIDKL